ncbi:DUF3833 domain-containing protein [Alteromonas sp. C1M14]|uniref:DUF3833 domain-containing protein n=1 Tax=Alteromonas sp. C1M14 TaxID=2841567 RepID=UPI001C08B73F|nr:DUF3833 domain-containing protein [Alteromonas sp. C1M14]MBU2979468.1 DUF3833 domain-containing protein [Alteromonas sp. C1M14]
MAKVTQWWMVLVGVFMLTGCARSLEGEQYQNQQPVFSLNDFFSVPVKAWGIVQDRSGNVIQRFTVDIMPSQQGNVLVLDESFTYQLGSGPASRTWRITKINDATFRGEADDITGFATGTSYGNAFNFNYSMDLPVGDDTYAVTFDDWFFSMGEDAMMNRSYIKKFGIEMAEVTIFMQRQPR